MQVFFVLQVSENGVIVPAPRVILLLCISVDTNCARVYMYDKHIF